MRKNVQILSNDAFAFAEDRGAGRNVGQVALANEERFTAAYYSEPLTTYGLGWRDPENLQATLDAIAPLVETPRRFEYKATTNAEEFLSESDDVRAIGSSFKKVEYKGSSVNAKTLNKGLTITLDKDELVPGKEERTVARLINRGWRNDLRRTIALIVANAYANTAKAWSTATVAAPQDPDQDVRDQLATAITLRGLPTNVAVYSLSAWYARERAHRANNTAGGFASAAMTPDQVAAALMLDKVFVNRSVYQSTSAAKAAIAGAYVMLYYAAQIPDLDDPSNVKQFWSPTESGRIRVYREEHVKTIDITVERYSVIAIPSALGILVLTIS